MGDQYPKREHGPYCQLHPNLKWCIKIGRIVVCFLSSCPFDNYEFVNRILKIPSAVMFYMLTYKRKKDVANMLVMHTDFGRFASN